VITHPDKVIRRVRQLLAQGMSTRKAAKEVHLARNTVVAIGNGIRKLKSETPPGRTLYGRKRRPPLTSKNPYRKRAASMYLSGKTLAEIGEKAGVTVEAVRQWLKKDGVKRRKSADRRPRLD
jgi:transposase